MQLFNPNLKLKLKLEQIWLNPYAKGWLMSFIAISCFSCKAILVKLMYASAPAILNNLMPIWTVVLRMLVALPIFAFVAYKTWQPLNKKQCIGIMFAGFLGYYAASFLDFWCLQYIPSSLERLILFLNPSFVLLLSFLILKQRIYKKQILAMCVAYVGVLLIFSHELWFNPHHLSSKQLIFGGILALLSTFSYALYLVLCARLVKSIGSLRLTALATCVACALCLTHFFVLNNFSSLAIKQLIEQTPTIIYHLSMINGIVCTVIPLFLTMKAIDLCGANIVAKTGVIGPSITIILGVWLLNEPFTIYHAIGTVLTLASMMLLSKN